jgi:hypothetical protein
MQNIVVLFLGLYNAARIFSSQPAALVDETTAVEICIFRDSKFGPLPVNTFLHVDLSATQAPLRSLASAAAPIPNNTVKAVTRLTPRQRIRAGITTSEYLPLPKQKRMQIGVQPYRPPCLRSASAYGGQNPLRWINGRASSELGHFDPIRAYGEYRSIISAAGWLPVQAAKPGINLSHPPSTRCGLCVPVVSLRALTAQ